MSTVKYCPSKKLGLCNFINRYGEKACYAYKAELRSRNVYLYRKAQHSYYHRTQAAIILDGIEDILKKHPIKYFRYNEAGDFESQEDVVKLDTISTVLKERHRIITYGYTSRKDLNFDYVNFIVRGSGWKANRGEVQVIDFKTEEKNVELITSTNETKKFFVCPGKGCGHLCKKCMGRTNYIAFHKH